MFDFDYWFDKAQKFRDDKQYKKAIECYEKILEFYPQSHYALTMIGSCYSELKQFGKALTYVNKAIEINPTESLLWFNKALVYYKDARYGEALKNFDKAISLKHDDDVSWYFKGWCYYYLNNIPKAIESFEISCNIKYDQETINIINDLKRQLPYSNHTRSSGKIECPNCGRQLNSSAITCGFCGHSLMGGSGTTTDSNSSFKRCPQCGTFIRKNKKVCPKCNYNLKSNSNKPKNNNTPKKVKPRINKPVNVKHFDDGVISFDYPDNYSKDFNLKYEKIGILASFKIGSTYSLESSFAIFDGQPITDKISDSKYKQIIKKSLNANVLSIKRSSFGEKERVIIEIQNKTSGNIEYYCNVPEIGYSVLFVIPYGKENRFNEQYVSTVVNSLEKSTGAPIIEDVKEKSKTCPNCGSENPDDSIFCMECGMKLDISNDVNFCIHCGTEVVPGAKFCLNCGKLIEY